MDKILLEYWADNAPDTKLDALFVNKVIYPAMKYYAEQQVKLFAIPDVSDALPFAYNYCPMCGSRTVKFRNKSRCIDINCKSNDC